MPRKPESPVLSPEDIEVVKQYNLGFSIQYIASKLDLTKRKVRDIVQKAQLQRVAERNMEALTEEVFKQKIPLCKEIASLTLSALKDFLVDLNADEEKKSNLTIDEAKSLSDILGKMDTLVRLDAGQPTQNIQHNMFQLSIQEKRVLLDTVKKNDPIFSYPTLDDKRPGLLTIAEPVSSPTNAEGLCEDQRVPQETLTRRADKTSEELF